MLSSGAERRLWRPSSLITDLADDPFCPLEKPGPILLEPEVVTRISCRVREVDGGLLHRVRLVDRVRSPAVLLLERDLRVVGGGLLPDLATGTFVAPAFDPPVECRLTLRDRVRLLDRPLLAALPI